MTPSGPTIIWLRHRPRRLTPARRSFPGIAHGSFASSKPCLLPGSRYWTQSRRCPVRQVRRAVVSCQSKVRGNVELWRSLITTRTVIQLDPEIQGGTPVFVGTRVPVKTLFDYLEAGDSLTTFCEDFPSVARELCVAALEQAREALSPDAHPA